MDRIGQPKLGRFYLEFDAWSSMQKMGICPNSAPEFSTSAIMR